MSFNLYLGKICNRYGKHFWHKVLIKVWLKPLWARALIKVQCLVLCIHCVHRLPIPNPWLVPWTTCLSACSQMSSSTFQGRLERWAKKKPFEECFFGCLSRWQYYLTGSGASSIAEMFCYLEYKYRLCRDWYWGYVGSVYTLEMDSSLFPSLRPLPCPHSQGGQRSLDSRLPHGFALRCHMTHRGTTINQ